MPKSKKESKKAPASEDVKVKEEVTAVKSEPGTTKKIKKSRMGSSASSATAAVAKVTAGTISKAAKVRIDKYGRLVYNRVKFLYPSLELSNKGAYALSCMVDQFLEEGVGRVLDIFGMQGRKAVNAQDVFVALRTLLPQFLFDAANARGFEAIAARRGNARHLDAMRGVMQWSPSFPARYASGE